MKKMDEGVSIISYIFYDYKWRIHRYFNSQIGLRNVYLISPYLFIIMAKALGRMIRQACENQLIKGDNPTPNCDLTTHHQFFDDIIFVGRA